jgi:hypothetical protein
MASERELKRQPPDLASARAITTAIVELCQADSGGPEVYRLTSRYLDTGNGLLGHSGVGLRARGDPSEQEARWTIKIGAIPDARGVAEATEIEIDGLWREIPAIFAMGLRAAGVSVELEEVARLTTVRERWIRSYAGAQVEICMDSVSVEYPKQFSFFEIEVEAPERSVLDQLLDFIEDHFPEVPPSPGSKLAMALSGGVSAQTAGRQRATGSPAEQLGVDLARFLDAVAPLAAPWATVVSGRPT